MSDPTPPPPSAPSAPSAPTQTPPAYTKGALNIFFSTSKLNPLDAGETTITARYVNTGAHDIEQFSLQAAVPKTMTLSMQAASGTTITSTAPVTQTMTVVAAPEHGAKTIALRLKLSWTENGQAMNDMATIPRID
jgi:AP-1 complex subunit gamma-1